MEEMKETHNKHLTLISNTTATSTIVAVNAKAEELSVAVSVYQGGSMSVGEVR